jgi:phage tail-like protein
MAFIEIGQKTYYALYDFLVTPPTTFNGMAMNFDTLTGGEMTVSSIPYNVVSEDGLATVKYMPGITKYSPVTLLRAFDNGAVEMYDKFQQSSNLNLKVRGNYSVVMIDTNGGAQAYWHLINAIPTKISGFSFNAHTAEYYTDFEITLQPEYIELVFP